MSLPAGSRYVALGSSFAAGPGIDPVVDQQAGRSSRNYAHLLAAELDLDLVDVTRSGATSTQVSSDSQDGAPPQLTAVTPDARLVTLTVGGNDLDYIGRLIAASRIGSLVRPLDHLGHSIGPVARPLASAARHFAEQLRRRANCAPAPPAVAEQVAQSLNSIVTAVRERAPDCRVVLVDYLTVLGPATKPLTDVPLTADQIRAASETASQLEQIFATAAHRAGAELVTASAASRDHAVGSADPWITGFSWRSVPYHPTAAGMAAVARLLAHRLTR